MFKDCEVQYKDAGTGSIEGYASTWIRQPDSYGDVVAKGAFTKTLAERWNGGKGIPFLWAHQMDNLKSFIGTAEADEDDKGLHFVATFDGTEEAQKVRQLYKDGRLRKFSFLTIKLTALSTARLNCAADISAALTLITKREIAIITILFILIFLSVFSGYCTKVIYK